MQGSVLATTQNLGPAGQVGGVGFEGQARYTPVGLWSIGAGLQYTTHSSGGESLNLSGIFVEPRFALDIGSDLLAPYLAGRIAFLHESSHLSTGGSSVGAFSSNGNAFGIGAGLLVRVSHTVNLDLGLAVVDQSFGSATSGGSTATFKSFVGYVAKIGASVGFGTR